MVGRRRAGLTALSLLATVLVPAASHGQLVTGRADTSPTGRESRQARSVEVLLQTKVPAAVARLDQTVKDLEQLTTAAPTETLLATWRELIDTRLEFNAVDHAFKPGRVMIGNRRVDTRLTLDTVAPQLQALTLAELRIQDELARRGVEPIPAGRSARDWLVALAPDLYQQAVSGYLDRTYPSLVMLPNGLGWEITRDGQWHLSQASLDWQIAFQRGDMDPRIAAPLAAIRPGQLESELTRMLSRYGLAPFGKGVGTYELPPARPVPPPPRDPKTWDDISGNGAG